MTVRSIHFTQQVPVLGTSQRIDHFDAEQGWLIEPDGKSACLGVRISRPATQNVPAIAPFLVRGVPYSVPA
jgi:hypothetical protein